ncbi:MAG TPA: hypothetical protein VK488_12025 [Gaiellaceae bacterium]|nr:hypothetical protein [Gaiellaceae bacterium]
MARGIKIAFVTAVAALALTGQAQAVGGNYVFDGGSAKQRTQVRSALNASSFNWSLVPAQIKIHIGPFGTSDATSGEIWLDGRLLNSGKFAWATVQHEYAHQIDFFLVNAATRPRLLGQLGGKGWFQSPGLAHAQLGSERFASTLAWAYWPSKDNVLRPTSSKDESAAMAPQKFRAFVKQIVGG